jgi:hypothetical protein
MIVDAALWPAGHIHANKSSRNKTNLWFCTSKYAVGPPVDTYSCFFVASEKFQAAREDSRLKGVNNGL